MNALFNVFFAIGAVLVIGGVFGSALGGTVAIATLAGLIVVAVTS